MTNDIKKLYRSEKDSMLWGILGGLGEYFNMDSTILRLGYVVLLLVTGVFPGVIAYIIAYFIIPERPMGHWKETKDEPIITPPPKPQPTPVQTPESRLNEIVNGKATEHAHSTPLVIPEEKVEEIGELKKPNWPAATKELLPKVEVEKEPHTATLDALLEEESEMGVGLDDVIDE